MDEMIGLGYDDGLLCFFLNRFFFFKSNYEKTMDASTLTSASGPVATSRHLRCEALLGEGSFGCVYRAQNMIGTEDWVERRRNCRDDTIKATFQPKVVAVKVSIKNIRIPTIILLL